MKYNQPYGISDPEAPYINGNPSTGTMGSIPPAASIEYPQREIVNMIADAGIEVPDNAQLHQLARAIQSGLVNYARDTGTSNAYACNLTPAPLDYYEGLEVILLILNPNSGPSVLNLNSLGNKPIIRYDGTELTGGELKANMLACFRYDGAAWQQVWPATYSSGGLVYLAAPLDLYVNWATGSDTLNDGLTAATPFKNIQKAVDTTVLFNLNGYSMNIHVADSVSYGPTVLPPINGSGTVNLIGNHAAPVNCLISAATGSALIVNGGPYSIDGFAFSAPLINGGDPGCGINVSPNAFIVINAAYFYACRSGQIETSGTAWVVGPIIINGGAFAHIFAKQAGRVILNPIAPYPTLTIGSGAFSVGFAWASQLGIVYAHYGTLTGAATGPKYAAELNGVIDTLGMGASYFPGSTAGTLSTGGQYA